ncbi:hypothetical protein KL911_000364 [Ogataea haglerorum]|uniref:uncharacterized protein n=1 Tax=Ogataea haglerorum TaxID=1937702 RepID=UPI001C890F52|nr:uncharacterized protein KL911_000364 [Ogataea haglerorum]KAG7759227.1 hypothetical protein KL911_000364 [Ogataea haglerorum]
MMSTATPSSLTDESAHSKPGRKPINTEPSNKRTAQNRAAQRAFRERKEKKMRELEMKVQMLENEKMQIANETELLRIQVNTLMNRLMNRGEGDFLKELPILADIKQQNTNTSTTLTSTDSEKSTSNTSSPNNSTHTPASSCSSAAEKSTEFLFPWAEKQKQANLTAVPKDSSPRTDLHDLSQKNYKGDFEEESFCNSLGTVCGDKNCPVPRDKRPSTVTGGSTLPSSRGVGSAYSPSPFQMLADYGSEKPDNNELPFLFDTPTYDTSLVFDQVNPSAFSPSDIVFSSIENEFPVTTEADPLQGLISEESKDDPLSEFFTNAQQQQLTVNNLNSLNGTLTQLTPGAAPDDNDKDEAVPDTTKNLMKCSQIWERITTHPKFSELDIDGLCSELKMKAKCSEKGVVVDGSDVGEVLTRVMNR